MLPQSERVVSTSAALLTNKMGEDFRLASQTTAFEVAPTGIQHTTCTATIQGGKALYVEALTARTLSIYALDGRCVRTVNLQAGKNVIQLPNGVYIVDDTKVMICK
jgi:hypothetical protein